MTEIFMAAMNDGDVSSFHTVETANRIGSMAAAKVSG